MKKNFKLFFYYVSAFDTSNISTNVLLNMYNDDKDNLYYLKPFLDCYALMDKSIEPSEEDSKSEKPFILDETIIRMFLRKLHEERMLNNDEYVAAVMLVKEKYPTKRKR